MANSVEPAPDFDRYYEIASTHGRPYVDYQVEHPVGTLLLFKALALAPGGRASFGRGIVAANVCADAIIIASLSWAWGVVAAAYFALVALPIASLLFNRIDLWSMAAATAALAAWRRDRPLVAAALLASGASLKLWPLVFVGALFVAGRSRARRLAAIAVFAGIAGAFACVAWWLAGPRSMLEVLTFRGARGWQIESLVGSVLHLAHPGALRLESGAWRIGAATGTMAVTLFAIAMPLSVWTAWRGLRAGQAGLAWLASVSALLLFSALFSAQYAGWLIPGGGVAAVEGHRRPAWLVAIVVLLTATFWTAYDRVLAGSRPALVVIVARNAVVLLLALDAIGRLARAQRSNLT